MKRTSFFILIFLLVSALDILCLFQNQHWDFLVMFTQIKKLATAIILIIAAIVYSAVLDWKETKGKTRGRGEA